MTATVGIDPRLKARRIAVQRDVGRRRLRRLQAVGAVIVAFGVFQVAQPLIESGFDIDIRRGGRLLGKLPWANLFFAYWIYKWRGEGLHWLAIMNGISLFGLWNVGKQLMDGQVEAFALAQVGFALAIAGLAWYLSARLVPNYTEEKDPLGQLPPRIVFPPDEGMMG